MVGKRSSGQPLGTSCCRQEESLNLAAMPPNCERIEQHHSWGPSREDRERERIDVLTYLRQNTGTQHDIVGFPLPNYCNVGTMTEDKATDEKLCRTKRNDDNPVMIGISEFEDEHGICDSQIDRNGNKTNCAFLDVTEIGIAGCVESKCESATEVQQNSLPPANIRSLYVKGRVEGFPVDFLVDTGADVTVISQTLLRKLPNQDLRQWEDKSYPLHAADGTVIKAFGPIPTSIELCGKRIITPVCAAEVVDPVVLGLPALRQLDALLDLGSCELRIGNCRIPCQDRIDRGVQKICRVTVARGCVVPPWTEQMIPAKVNGIHLGPPSLWFIDDPGGANKINRNLLVARTLEENREDGLLAVRVVNMSLKPVSVKKGKIIANAEVVQPDDVDNFHLNRTITEVKTDSAGFKTADVPEHLKILWEETCQAADLDEVNRKKLAKMFCQRQNAFACSDTDIGRTTLIAHDINTEGAVPIKQQPRRPPVAYAGEVTKQVDELLKNQLIEPSTSPWASPVVLVKKKDGSVRFCIDYRQLNSVSRKDAFPLPRIDETLDSLRGATWFSTLDLLSGYWQVGMTERAQQASAFVTRDGLFQWKVMPFGLCNAPATFERLMEAALRGLQWSSCLVYLDDVIVFAKSVPEMIDRLDAVLERIENSGLKLKPRKCCLFRRSVGFLGHVVSQDGIAVDPDKISAVKDWYPPSCVREVRAFVGFASYYRRFVKNFASIASPLHTLTKTNVDFMWTKNCQEAFEKLKDCLSTAPVLTYPDMNQQFILDTDASNEGLGAVLSQQCREGERPVAFASRTLNDQEKNYCATRKELLGVIFGLKQYRHYLLGRTFILRTDHGSLQWLLRFKKPEGQIARWLEVMSEYSPIIIHRPGLKHNNADGLSRKPCRQCDGKLERARQADTIIEREEEIADWPYLRNIHNYSVEDVMVTWPSELYLKNIRLEPTLGLDEVQQLQESDNELKPIRDWLTEAKEPTVAEMTVWTQATRAYWSQRENMYLHEEVLYRQLVGPRGNEVRRQLLVPKGMKEDVLQTAHDLNGHFAVQKTAEKIRQKYYWYHLVRDVRQWCGSCIPCGATKGKPNRPNQRLVQELPTRPLARIAIDIAGPLPKTDQGNIYFMVVSDYFTKFADAYPLPNQEAKTCATVLVEQFMLRYGIPLVLHSDQGRNFDGELLRGVCELLEIKKTRTSPLHPQSDGLVERLNRTLKEALRKLAYENPQTWDKHLRYVMAAYNSSRQSSTEETPNYLMFGREVVTPLTLLDPLPEESVNEHNYVQVLRERMETAYEWVRLKLSRSLERQRRNYDKVVKEETFNVGEQVWVYQPTAVGLPSRALNPKWRGPHRVIKQLPAGLYVIMFGPHGQEKVIHGNRLRKYHNRTPIMDEPVNQELNTVEEREAELPDEEIDDNLETRPIQSHTRPERLRRRPQRLDDYQ